MRACVRACAPVCLCDLEEECALTRVRKSALNHRWHCRRARSQRRREREEGSHEERRSHVAACGRPAGRARPRGPHAKAAVVECGGQHAKIGVSAPGPEIAIRARNSNPHAQNRNPRAQNRQMHAHPHAQNRNPRTADDRAFNPRRERNPRIEASFFGSTSKSHVARSMSTPFESSQHGEYNGTTHVDNG